MISVVCTLLGAAGFYLSYSLGEIWPLAWLAPLPLLWLAASDRPIGRVALAAWLAYALGSANMLPAYGASLPIPVLSLALAGPALGFAGSVLGARFVLRHSGALAGMVCFAALFTLWDYIMAFGVNGTAPSPSSGQVGAPWLIQSASLFGPWSVTFLLALVPAGLAFALSHRRRLPALLALALFVVNGLYGVWRIAEAPARDSVRIGLAVDDSRATASFRNDESLAMLAVDAYDAAVRSLAAKGARMIVLPEKLAILSPPWRAAALTSLQRAASESGSVIVAGFDDRGDGRRNDAVIFTRDAASPQIYVKRHFVPGLEDGFARGTGPFMLPDRTGVEICKDMDFPAMLRADARLGHPDLLLVPAWDFGRDHVYHRRMAILRGVEEGFALARAAKEGDLTLTDAFGRMIAVTASHEDGMITLIGDLQRGPGRTLYQTVGDSFAWLCGAVALLLLAGSWRRSR